jgi:hypothetical protein
MIMSKRIASGIVLAAAGAAMAAGRAAAVDAPTPPADPAALAEQNADLRRRVDAMQRQLNDLSHQIGVQPAAVAAAPSTAPAAPPAHPAAVAPTFQSLFLDNKPVELPGDVSAGYKDGFYLHQGDQFGIVLNGLFDVRYSFDQLTNKTPLTTTPIGKNHVADYSGFNLFNSQVSAQGYMFKSGQSEAFFKAMGNFGTLGEPSGATGGSFLVNELYGGYAVNDGLRFRAGAMVVPISPLRTITDYGGLTFPDAADTVSPLLPGFALGADVLGALANNTVSYDVMVNNGTTSNNLINSTSPLTGRDNRFGVYTREQIVGAGKLSDFLDESDVAYHDHFVWIVGGGFGFESQNAASTAFPGPQTTLGLSGISSPTGIGFLARTALTGDAYKYVADVRGKVRGFSFFGEALYQNFASESKTLIAGYPRHSIGQTGYFAQAGYFVIPKHLEVAGRYGQLYTDDLHHEMDEITGGVNYYLFGQNLKLQVAETYVPRQAALTSGNGITLNTQDWVTEVQMQLKF